MRWVIATALVLCLGTGARAGDDFTSLVKQLTGKDTSVCYAAYNRLRSEKDGAKIVALLAHALPGATELGQYYGVLILQQHYDTRGRAVLKILTSAKSPYLRVLTAAALHRRGEKDAAPVIVKALRAAEGDDRLLGIMLMRAYSLRGPKVQAAIRGYLSPERSKTVLEPAIYGVYLTRDEAAVQALKGLFEHEDGGIRGMAAGCALLLGHTGATPVLVEAIKSGGLGSSQLYKVKNFLTQTVPVPVAVLAAAHGRLADETNPYTLRTLIELLGDHGYTKATQSIRELLDHKDASVSKEAFSALARFPGALTRDAIRGLLEGGDDGRKLAAVDALRRLDDVSGRDIALKILREGKLDTNRWEAATVLGKFRDEKVVEPLIDALMDEHLTVRAHAYNSVSAVLRGLFPYRRFDFATTGYATSAAKDARQRGADRIRAWWRTRRSGTW